jgi:hypothetical protein
VGSSHVRPAKEGIAIETPREKQYHEEDLGFEFLERMSEDSPGYSRLDIVIREHPSEAHFDPERVELGVVSEFGGVENRSIAHPWPWHEQTRATPGFVTLRDRKDKYIETFTFGGTLTIQPYPEITRCSLTSEAPILNLNQIPGFHNLTIPYMLAMQAQILLARRRAAWLIEPMAFQTRLAAVEPLEFYGSCIRALIVKYGHFPTSTDVDAQGLLNFLNEERERIHSRLRGVEKLPKIEEIL